MIGGHRGILDQETLKPRSVRATLGRFVHYFTPYWLALLVTILMLFANAWVQVITPELFGQAVDCYFTPGIVNLGDEMVNGPDVPQETLGEPTASESNCWFSDLPPDASTSDLLMGLTRLTLVLVGLFALGAVAAGLMFYLMSWMGQHVLRVLRTEVFKHLHRLSLGFYSKQESGDLMSRITNDTNTIQQAVSFALIQVASGIVLLIWMAWKMLTLNFVYGLLSLVVVPFMAVTTLWFSNQARKAFRKTREEIGNVNAELEEGISGVREVQAFSREDANIESFRQSNAANRDANVRAVTYTSALAPALEALGYVAIALVAGIGGVLMLRGVSMGGEAISIGLIVTYLAYVQRFNQPIQQISVLWTNIQSAIAGAERIFDLLDEEPDIHESLDAKDLPQIVGRVVFDNVGAEYNPGEPVLQGIDLVAEPGQTIAIVGPTGAGKTTLVNLAAPFLRRDIGHGLHRRRGCARCHAAQPAQPDRRRAAGLVPLQRHGDEQHPLRPARRQRRGGHGGGQAGPCPRLHRAAAGRLREHAGRAGRRAEPGPAPVALHRPRRAGRPTSADPRRGHQQRRHAHRAPDPGRAGRVAGRPHQLRHRPPAEHDPQRRSGAGVGRRRDCRAGYAYRVAGETGRVLRSVYESVSGAGEC